MNTKAVIFDLNGVFIQSPKLSDSFSEEYGVPVEKFLPALKNVLSIARKPGCADSYALWRPYLEEWGIDLKKEEFFNFWFSKETEIQELIDYAKELREQGVKIIALSNNFKERTNYYIDNFTFMREVLMPNIFLGKQDLLNLTQ